ncbi:MAG TPA: type II CRISPR RNA-guided endonuclease Cas9 [Candidatus Brocadiia bacterium]|nr:type II CRISPR RNA-guided endonuclease Cas9 [Candidatus Brocadiia bacterium]
MGEKERREYVLGLDIGATSVGWAAIESRNDEFTGLLASGVRIFEAGVEGTLDTIESGKDDSRAKGRREKRSSRRRQDRLARRLVRLFGILREAGLFPTYDIPQDASSPKPGGQRKAAERDYTLKRLRADLLSAWDMRLRAAGANDDSREIRLLPDLLPYLIRSRAVSARIEKEEIALAIYHIAHRRGFLSNRKELPKDDKEKKDEGKVKESIGELRKLMQEAGTPFLSQYFTTLNPHEARVRSRYTARAMYEEEFDAIWKEQEKHYPGVLTPALRKKVHNAIFFQRPLKSAAGLIGQCELEQGHRRAPMALPECQRFRYLQKINDLDISHPDGTRTRPTPEEREKLVAELEHSDSVTFAKMRKILGISRLCEFNLERGGDKSLKGNTTSAKMRNIFGARWDSFSIEEQHKVIEDINSIQKPATLKSRGMRVWGLKEEQAQEFSEIILEPDYCNLSLRAIRKLLPSLEEGTPYKTAEKAVYGDRPTGIIVDVLPPVRKQLKELRNPAVERALTELRKVVNAVVRRYGKPAAIRIELARHLKRPRKARVEITKKIRRNEAFRKTAAEKIAKEVGITNPSRSDIEKVLLWQECGGVCPYTGKSISIRALFGHHPQFDVEHIIPRSRSFDNSFLNKTLCDAAENRKKRARTPWEAYGSDEKRWGDILDRVARFDTDSDTRTRKLELFRVKDLQDISDFASSQLNDTAYASREACRYLGMLYGGVTGTGRRTVQATQGRATALLRATWKLNDIIGGGEKTRDDHRHHAIDAIVVALTAPGMIQKLSRAVQQSEEKLQRAVEAMNPPWEGFFDDAKRVIEGMAASHRVNRKVNGPLHEETVYAKRLDENGKECFHVRKPVYRLSPNEVEQIADPVVRERVKARIAEVGDIKALEKAENLPFMQARDGRRIPIKSVRVRVSANPRPIGSGADTRYVKPGSNHHVEIVETTDKRGRKKWEGFVVTSLDAMTRLRNKEPIVKKDHGPGKDFVFSLAGGETIQHDTDDGPQLFRIRTVSQTNKGYPRIDYVRINDARLKKEIMASGDWFIGFFESLRELNCRKVVILPTGEIRTAND